MNFRLFVFLESLNNVFAHQFQETFCKSNSLTANPPSLLAFHRLIVKTQQKKITHIEIKGNFFLFDKLATNCLKNCKPK